MEIRTETIDGVASGHAYVSTVLAALLRAARTGTGVLASAAAAGRAPRFGLNGFVIARDSRAEAEETLREIVAKAHRPAVEGFRQSV